MESIGQVPNRFGRYGEMAHDHSYREQPNEDLARLDLLSHWEGQHIAACDSYEDAGGNAQALSWFELVDLHRDEHDADAAKQAESGDGFLRRADGSIYGVAWVI